MQRITRLESNVQEIRIAKRDEVGQLIETLTVKPEEKLVIHEYPDGRIETEEIITWL